MSNFIDLTNAWFEWEKICELDGCSDTNIADLCKASDKYFDNALKKMQGSISSIISLPPKNSDTQEGIEYRQRYTFHLMESELLYVKPLRDKNNKVVKDSNGHTVKVYRPRVERQRFKRRIFARAKNVGSVTGYFLKAFFRSFVKDRRNISYNAPDTPEDKTVEDWKEELIIRSPYAKEEKCRVCQEDIAFIEKEVNDFWSKLSDVEKAILIWKFYFIQKTPSKQMAAYLKIGTDFYKRWDELEEKIRESFSSEDIRCYSAVYVSNIKKCCLAWLNQSTCGQWIRNNFSMRI